VRKINVHADVGARVDSDEIGARLYELEDGQRSAPYHFHHAAEEWLIVIAGAPRVRTPTGERALREGDVVCFPAGPDGAHEVTGPGTVLILSDNRAPGPVEYPESGEIAVGSGRVFRLADAIEIE
jgi:uncharacterized cupin superfamily protein